MASRVNPWLVGPQYWTGWEAFSWQTSWGYDAEGEPIEVEPHGGGGGAGEEVKRRKKTTHRNRDERDLMEMLTIIVSSGVLNV